MTRRRVTALVSSTVLLLAACSGTTMSRDSDSGGNGGKSQGAGGVAEGNGGADGGKDGTGAAGVSGGGGVTATGGASAGGRGGVTATGGASAGGRANGGAPGAGGRTGAGGIATAGRSGTGGSAGTGAAGPVDAGGVDGSQPDALCDELASTSPLVWGPDGGLVAYTFFSTLTPPRRYQGTSLNQRTGMQLSCTTEVRCPSALIAEINSALGSSAVQNALSANTLFGVDSRPSDGQVFRLKVGLGYLEVGTECPSSSSSCRPVLPEVQALVDALQALEVQELRKPACTGLPVPA